jgi:SAM-dependent methyltransferase
VAGQTQTPVDFDAYRDSYRDAVEDAIAFSGTDLDFFTRAKVRTLLEVVSRRVGDPNALAFLDVGCGPGETDGFLHGEVGSLTGVDIATEMVTKASERNPWAEYRSFEAGEPIPVGDGTADVTFAICVLHHVRPAARDGLIAEMRRATKPGGVLVLFEHNPFNPLTRRVVSNCEFDRDAQLLSRRTAARLLENGGMTDLEGDYILFVPRDSRLISGVERRLGWLPLGAQYMVSGRR